MITDEKRKTWCSDISELLDFDGKQGIYLWNLIKNHCCHQVVEAMYNNIDREFKILVPPIGYVTLGRDAEGNWMISKIDWSEDFLVALNDTINSRESNLHRQLSESVKASIRSKIQQFSHN